MFANGYGTWVVGSARQPAQTADAHIELGRASRAHITDVVIKPKSVGGEPQFLVNEPDERIQIKDVEVLAAGAQRRIGIPQRRVRVERAGKIRHATQGRLDLVRDGGLDRGVLVRQESRPDVPADDVAQKRNRGIRRPRRDRGTHGGSSPRTHSARMPGRSSAGRCRT